MASTGILNGSDLLVYVAGTAVAHSTSHSLSCNMATRDATTKDNAGWRVRLDGMRDWSTSGEGLLALDAAYGASELFTIFTNRTECTVVFSTDTSGDEYWSGSAYLTSLELSVPMEENATYSFSFESSSALTQYTGT